MSTDKTKEKILLTAEYLFADQGYDATSIRQIVTDAGVNIAAIHYHFGSKADLFLAVIRYRFEPLQEARLQILNKARLQGLTVESLVRSFIQPVFDISSKDPSKINFIRLMNHRFFSLSKQNQQQAYERFIKVTRDAYVNALRDVLPDSSNSDIYWHFHLMIGVVTSLSSNNNRLSMISEGACEPASPEETCERIVQYLSQSIEATKELEEVHI